MEGEQLHDDCGRGVGVFGAVEAMTGMIMPFRMG